MSRFTSLFTIFYAILLFAISCAAQTGEVPIKVSTFKVDDRTDYVNVMGNETPAMPQFPNVSIKAGYVRGYVKNVLGDQLLVRSWV